VAKRGWGITPERTKAGDDVGGVQLRNREQGGWIERGHRDLLERRSH